MDRLMRFLRRHHEGDEGFTLIELMVVVLIIGILVAIAVPTFLGARNGAEDRAVESSLRNGLTAAKTYYTNNNYYDNGTSSANTAALLLLEPSLAFTDTEPAASAWTQPNNIFVASGVNATGTASIICMEELSKTGNYFAIFDSSSSSTLYYKGTADPKCASTMATTTPSGAGWSADAATAGW